MTREERKLALYCLKASSDYHSEVCEECINYPNCDHTIQDDVTETIIKALEQEPKTEQEDDYFRKIVEVAISQLRADRDRLEDELAKREQEPLTEEDYIELHDRFGDYVEFVVRDMVSGKGERWTKKDDNNPQYCIGGHMYGAMGGDVIMDILAGKGKK